MKERRLLETMKARAVGTLLLLPLVGIVPQSVAAEAEQAAHFEKHIRPLFVENCVKCHGPKLQQKELRLDSAAGLRQGSKSGPVVVPGDPDKSRLIQLVRGTPNLRMPPKGDPLRPTQIAALEEWVRAGAVWPEYEEESTTTDGDPASQTPRVEPLQPDAPSLLPDLELWLKADGLPQSDGVSVSVWHDQSPHGRHLAAPRDVSRATPPRLVAESTIYRHPALRFTEKSGMVSTATPLDLANDAELTFFAVANFQAQENDSTRRIFSITRAPEADLRPIDKQNVALLGKATQSSTLSGAEAAIDGNLETFSHTLDTQDPEKDGPATWKLDLGQLYDIESIVLHNRPESEHRLRDITVRIEDLAGAVVFESELLNPENKLESPRTLGIDLIAERGDTVRGGVIQVIRTPDPDFSGSPTNKHNADARVLSLGEVVVLGGPPSDPSKRKLAKIENVAGRGKVTMTSLSHGAPAAVNDGQPGSIAHTSSKQEGIHSIELALHKAYDFREIVLHNRPDCCQERLRDIRVSILDAKREVLFRSRLLNPENKLKSPETLSLAVASTGRIVRVERIPDPDFSGKSANVAKHPAEARVLALGELEIFAVTGEREPIEERPTAPELNLNVDGTHLAFETGPTNTEKTNTEKPSKSAARFDGVHEDAQVITITKTAGDLANSARFYVNGRAGENTKDKPTGAFALSEDGKSFILGAVTRGVEAFRGDIAELIVYKRALSEEERQRVEKHLGQKYHILQPDDLERVTAKFTEEAKKFWSFQPLKKPAIPQVRDTQWPTSPIDAFILAKLEEKNLRPAPEADRRTLLRRLYLDITGLPPTLAEVESFVADTSPKAYEELVEKLLDSPHYGERWARFWLDVVRYAESSANDGNYIMQYAYRYRDYVVNALNNDKPYDEFVVEQLGGDLLPPTGDVKREIERHVATGFLMLGTKALAEQDKEKLAIDIADDQIDATTRAFLGLTVSCARCHDHKFDPIPTVDYYSLMSIFRSTDTLADAVFVSKWHEWELETGKDKDGVPEKLMIMAPKDRSPVPMHVFVRGNYESHGEVVPRRFLQIIGRDNNPPIRTNQSGRLELGRWIARPDNPLTPRVAVNRVWQGHFGRGIVATSDNFGVLGEKPTHPELLDWLANEFIASGWSIKAIHRRLLNSSTYRMQSSVDDARAQLADAENKLLWRFPRRRMDAETLRDSILAINDRLDRTLGGTTLDLDSMQNEDEKRNLFSGASAGQGFKAYKTLRRSIYIPVIRNSLYEPFLLFDFADANAVTPRRSETTVAPQALFMLNSPFVTEQSRHLARTLVSSERTDEELVKEMHLRVLGRVPSAQEIDEALAFLTVARDFESRVDEIEEVAREGTASQTSNEFPARDAIDGRRHTVAHTSSDQDPAKDGNHAWELALDTTYYVNKIVLYNRPNCCADRMRDLVVTVYRNVERGAGSSERKEVFRSELLNPENSMGSPESIELVLGDENATVYGDIVRVERIPDPDYSGKNPASADHPAEANVLALSEVEVFTRNEMAPTKLETAWARYCQLLFSLNEFIYIE